MKMTIMFAPLLAAALVTSGASPALARHHGHTPARADAIRNQIAQLRSDVNRNDNRDHISEREAAGLRRDVNNLQAQFRDYNRNGLSNAEMATLENRIHNIRGRLHIERRDRDHHRM